MHPSASAPTENKLAARHVHYEFEPNLDITKIRDVEGIQVRLSEHRAPKATVDRYSQQMKSGATFPAIVVNDRYEIVDGNSRWIAAQRNRRETIAAYVCSDLSALQARSLSVELNQSHGLSMTEEEIRAFVTSAVEEGQVLDAKAYSRMTGFKASTLTRWVASKHFDMRAARAGLAASQLGDLADSVRAALNVAKLESVFVEATALAVDAKVPTAHLRTIITEANAAPSEARALAVVARERTARSDDIKSIACGFKSVSRNSKGSALHIGGLLRFQVTDLLDVSPEKQVEAYARMTCLRDRLDAALARADVEWSLEDSSRAVHCEFPQTTDVPHVG